MLHAAFVDAWPCTAFPSMETDFGNHQQGGTDRPVSCKHAADAGLPSLLVGLFLLLFRLVRHLALDARGPHGVPVDAGPGRLVHHRFHGLDDLRPPVLRVACDRIGPRLSYTWLLVVGSLGVMGIGLAHDYTTF